MRSGGGRWWILGLGFVVGSTAAAGRFHMPNTSFSIEMPADPKCRDASQPSPATSVPWLSCAYFDEAAGQGYALDVITLPRAPDASIARRALHGAASGSAAQTESEVTKEVEGEVDGYPSLDVVLVTRGSGYTTYIRYVLVGDRLVYASFDTGSASIDEGCVERFLGSLRVRAPDAPQ